MHRVAVCSVIALLCLGTPAFADGDANPIEVIKRSFERDVEGLNAYLTQDRVKAFASEPKSARSALEGIARFIRSMTMRSSDTGPIEILVEKCNKIGSQTLAAHADDADAYRTAAVSRVINGRFQIAAEIDPDVEDWTKACDYCLKAAELDEKGQIDHVVAAIWNIRAAAFCPSTDMDAIYKRTIEICDKYSPGTKEPLIAVERGETLLLKAQNIAGDKKRKKEVIATANEAITQLEKLVRDKTYGDRAKGLQNQARSLLLEKKLAKPELEMRSRKLGRNRFEISVPKGSHWKTTGGSSSGHVLKMTRSSVDGTFVSINLYSYSWSSLYASLGGDVGGDNLKGLMQDDQARDLEKMVKVEKHKKLVKGKLNRAVKKTTGYEVRGVDQDGDNWYVRAYLFKLSDWRSSYSLHVSIWGKNPRVDPEIAAVLKAFKPIPKKK